jgi:hypothetical protein
LKLKKKVLHFYFFKGKETEILLKIKNKK